MIEEAPLHALYLLGTRLRPEIERHGGRLLKVIFEFDGREIIYNHDERQFPTPVEPEREMLAPPPLPAPCRPAAPPLPAAPRPELSQPGPPRLTTNGRATTITVDGFELPIPPVAFESRTAHTVPQKPKRTDPVDGIVPLTDEDICPIAKKHPNTKMQDIPASYLDWLYGQDWLRSKHPRLWAYIVRHEDVITQELKLKGRV